MKKFLLTTLMLLVVGIFGAQAQRTGFGVKGGMNFSKFNAAGSDMRVSIHLGGLYRYMRSSSFAIQPEFALSLEGDANNRYTNLNLVGMAQYYFTSRFNMEGGPQLGIIIGNENTTTSTFNFSLGLGLGYSITNHWRFGGRYNIGLTDVSGTTDANIENSVFKLSGYFMF